MYTHFHACNTADLISFPPSNTVYPQWVHLIFSSEFVTFTIRHNFMLDRCRFHLFTLAAPSLVRTPLHTSTADFNAFVPIPVFHWVITAPNPPPSCTRCFLIKWCFSMPSLGIGALDALLEWQHLKQVNDARHDTYIIISLPLFCCN